MSPRRVRTAPGLLLGAADRIERHGFTRGCFVSAAGELCLLGALMLETMGELDAIPWWDEPTAEPPFAYMVAVRALAQHLGWDVDQHTCFLENQLFAWSDTVPADGAEVCDHLRSAAGLARGLAVGATA